MKKRLILGLGIPLGTVLVSGIVIGAICLNSTNVFNGSCKSLGKANELSIFSYDIYNSPEYKSYLQTTYDFSSDYLGYAISDFNNSKDNLVVSPLSLYFTLTMAGECASGDTKAQINSALGTNTETINKYIPYLYSLINEKFANRGLIGEHEVGEVSLTNSLWLDKNIDVHQSTIDTLNNIYYSDVFHANFSKKNNRTNKYISNYVKKNTHNLINKDYKLDKDTVFILLNTLYCKDHWNIFGNNLKVSNSVNSFAKSNGDIVNTKFYQGDNYTNGKAYEGEGYKAYYISTDNGVKVTFMVPIGNNSIENVMTNENINEVMSLNGKYISRDDDKKEAYYTRTHFPEFNAFSDLEISLLLENHFGISDMFDSSKANFSNLTDGHAYISGVIQTTKLEVDKKGIEGTSATAILGATSPGPDEYTPVYEEFIVDRAFGFFVSNGNTTPLFAGVINEVK